MLTVATWLNNTQTGMKPDVQVSNPVLVSDILKHFGIDNGKTYGCILIRFARRHTNEPIMVAGLQSFIARAEEPVDRLV